MQGTTRSAPNYAYVMSHQGVECGGVTYCATVEVVFRTQNDGLVLWDSLDLVTPLASDLDARLDGLGTCVHGQYHVKAKVAGDELSEAGEHVIVESARTQCDSRCLLNKSRDQFGVAVALVHSGVGREEVEIMTSFGVPDRSTLSTGKDHGQWVIVVGSIILLCLDSLSSRSSMVVGEGPVGPVGGHGGFCGELRRENV